MPDPKHAFCDLLMLFVYNEMTIEDNTSFVIQCNDDHNWNPSNNDIIEARKIEKRNCSVQNFNHKSSDRADQRRIESSFAHQRIIAILNKMRATDE
jgi:hypothetical protein